MMNLDPSTHFAKELAEFQHIEEQVEKQGANQLFTDEEEGMNLTQGCEGELLDGSDDDDLIDEMCV